MKYDCRACDGPAAQVLIEPHGAPTRYLPGWTYCPNCYIMSFTGGFPGNREMRPAKVDGKVPE